jgi:peptide-N4-(N-acetyl-beta-glucosaminyl)asparagine amidase
MDVTRRYVRNFSRWGAERGRAPETVLLYILDEIRAMRRKNLIKQEKFRLEGEDMQEYRELQGYVASAIAQEICKIIPGSFFHNSNQPPRPPPRRDPDVVKAEEARQDARRAQAERTIFSGPNGARGAPNPHNPDQPPQR